MTKTLKYLALTLLVSGLAACTTVNGSSPKFTPGNPKFTTGISGPMPVSRPAPDQ